MSQISYNKFGNLQIKNFFILLFLTIFLSYTILNEKKSFEKQQINNIDTIIFDLHGVVFRLNPLKVINEIFKSQNKKLIFSTIFYPKIIFKSFYQMYKGEVAEKVIFDIFKEYPNFDLLIPTGLKIINAQSIIPGILPIIKELKQKGYKLYIFSNIGENSINILKNKFPEIFELFDGISFTEFENNYVKKPDPRAFENHFNQFKHNKNNVIFIDDKIKNITAAKKLGINSIHFTSSYNFLRELKKNNIF